MTEAVVDSSLIAALVTPEERSKWASQKMLEHDYFHFLDLSHYEVANAIRHKTSVRFSSEHDRNAFSEAVRLMSLFALHSFSEIIDDAFAIASDLNITIYDAAFLSLADRLNLPFLTIDVKLAKKLEKTKYGRLFQCPKGWIPHVFCLHAASTAPPDRLRDKFCRRQFLLGQVSIDSMFRFSTTSEMSEAYSAVLLMLSISNLTLGTSSMLTA